MIRTGGKRFNPKEAPLYFAASNPGCLRFCSDGTNKLVAINEIMDSETNRARVQQFIADGDRVFIDSGIFNLTNQHARKHSVSMDTALALSPEEIDGFDELLEAYIRIIKQMGDSSWGYIELDQGGRENKMRTRKMLESKGLRPIPVYHPLNDGWDYFDYLAQKYDRICVGNIVQANKSTRRRIVATAWERRRKYPNLWIHLLGMTPSEITTSFPSDSCDSSSWLSPVIWRMSYPVTACNAKVCDLHWHFKTVRGADADSDVGHNKGYTMGSYIMNMRARGWAHLNKSYAQLGIKVR